MPAEPSPTKRAIRRLGPVIIACATAGWAVGAHAQFTTDVYENLHAPSSPLSMLPRKLVQSGHHRLSDIVLNGDGGAVGMLEFRVDSDESDFRVQSLPWLVVRIQEINAVAQAMDHFERSNKVLAERIEDQFRVSGDSALDILTSPIRTTTELVGQATTNFERTFGATPDNQALSANSGGTVYRRMVPTDPVVAAHKRSVAGQLDLDFYSTNPKVQSLLNTLAEARSTGRRGAGRVAVVSLRLEKQLADGGVRNRIRTALARNTIRELYKRNEARLVQAGVALEVLHPFLDHPVLSPSHKTILTEYAVNLEGVAGRELLLEDATGCADEACVMGAIESAKIVNQAHQDLAKLAALERVEGVQGIRGWILKSPIHQTAGVVVADVVVWNAQTAALLDQIAAAPAGARHLLLSGLASDRLKRQAERRDIRVEPQYMLR